MIPRMDPLGKITGMEVKHLYYSFNYNYETSCELNCEFFFNSSLYRDMDVAVHERKSKDTIM